MPKKIKTILVTRPFQPLFAAMDDLLAAAKPLHAEINQYDADNLHRLDRDLWRREKSFALGSFVMGMMALDSFVLNIWQDFAVRQPVDLTDPIFGGRKKRREWSRPKTFEDLRFSEKIYLLPTLCIVKPSPPAKFFKKNTKNWRRLHELITIRNRFVHALPVDYKHEITIARDKFQMIDSSSPDNFWPVTNIARDVRIFGYESAALAQEVICWTRDSIVTYLPGKTTPDYLNNESMQIAD